MHDLASMGDLLKVYFLELERILKPFAWSIKVNFVNSNAKHPNNNYNQLKLAHSSHTNNDNP